MQLTRLEILNKLAADGSLQVMVDRGIVSRKMHGYFQYYREVQFQLLNFTMTDAVIKTAEKLKVDERTIWRALKTIRG